MTKKWILPLAVLLFLAALVPLDRFFFKKNNSFCIHFIQAPLSHNPLWESSAPFPEEALSQPYSYLGKGSQSFVFESSDGKWVVKFYKFPSHMRRLSWIRHPLAYIFDPKRIAIKKHNIDRFQLSYNSYYTAWHDLQDESAIPYIHLNPTANLNKFLHITDRLGKKYRISLDSATYILQRKAQKIFPLLDSAMQRGDVDLGKKIVDELIGVIAARCRKGIADLDNSMTNNYGWLDGRAIHIDVGRFVRNEEVKTPAGCQKEVLHITQIFSDHLSKHYPELHEYYTVKIENLAPRSQPE